MVRRIWIGRGILVGGLGGMSGGMNLVSSGGIVVVLHWRTWYWEEGTGGLNCKRVSLRGGKVIYENVVVIGRASPAIGCLSSVP